MKKSNQKDTIKIPVSLNKEQLAVIESLQGIYGNSPASVIRNIIIMWIHRNVELPNIGVRKANSNMSEKQSFSEHPKKSKISDESGVSKEKPQLKKKEE